MKTTTTKIISHQTKLLVSSVLVLVQKSAIGVIQGATILHYRHLQRE